MSEAKTACMQKTVSDGGNMQICARLSGHAGAHWSRAGWLWSEVTPPSPQPEAPQEIEPAIKLLADVMHLWVDGYISKSPNSMAPSSIGNDKFDEIESFLDARGISVNYSGWSASEPKPATQTEQTEWHVCGWDMTLLGCEGMVEVLDSSSRLVCRAKDRTTAEFIVSRASIAAAKGTR